MPKGARGALYMHINVAMNIGYFALIVAGVLAVVAVVCWMFPAQPPRRHEIDYKKIYAATMPRDL